MLKNEGLWQKLCRPGVQLCSPPEIALAVAAATSKFSRTAAVPAVPAVWLGAVGQRLAARQARKQRHVVVDTAACAQRVKTVAILLA